MTDDTKKTATITIAITPEFKEEIRAVAKTKRWSVSQTLGILIEAYWEEWLREEGINTPEPTQPSKNSKTR